MKNTKENKNSNIKKNKNKTHTHKIIPKKTKILMLIKRKNNEKNTKNNTKENKF